MQQQLISSKISINTMPVSMRRNSRSKSLNHENPPLKTPNSTEHPTSGAKEKNQFTVKQFHDQKNSSKSRTLDDPKSMKSPRLNLEKVIGHENLHGKNQNKEYCPLSKNALINTKIKDRLSIPSKEENKVALLKNNTTPFRETKNPEKISIEMDTTIMTKPRLKIKTKSCSKQPRTARLSAQPNDQSHPINDCCSKPEAELQVDNGKKSTSKTSTDVSRIPSTEKNDTDVEGINEKDKITTKHMNEDKPQKARPKVHPTLTQYTEHPPKLSKEGDESISSETMIDSTRRKTNKDKPQKARQKVNPTLTQHTEHPSKVSDKGDESISSEMMIDATRSTTNEHETIIDDNKRNIAAELKGLYKGIDNSNDENKQNIHNVDLSPSSENEKYPELASPLKNKIDDNKQDFTTKEEHDTKQNKHDKNTNAYKPQHKHLGKTLHKTLQKTKMNQTFDNNNRTGEEQTKNITTNSPNKIPQNINKKSLPNIPPRTQHPTKGGEDTQKHYNRQRPSKELDRKKEKQPSLNTQYKHTKNLHNTDIRSKSSKNQNMMNNKPISEIQIKQHTEPLDTNDDDTSLETKTEPNKTKDNNHESYQKETMLPKKIDENFGQFNEIEYSSDHSETSNNSQTLNQQLVRAQREREQNLLKQ